MSDEPLFTAVGRREVALAQIEGLTNIMVWYLIDEKQDAVGRAILPREALDRQLGRLGSLAEIRSPGDMANQVGEWVLQVRELADRRNKQHHALRALDDAGTPLSIRFTNKGEVDETVVSTEDVNQLAAQFERAFMDGAKVAIALGAATKDP